MKIHQAPGTPLAVNAASAEEETPFLGWRRYIEPVYPLSLRRRGMEGFVDVLIRTDPTGKVVSWEILQWEGSDFFASAVQSVIARWEFLLDPTWERLDLPPPPFVLRVEFRLSD